MATPAKSTGAPSKKSLPFAKSVQPGHRDAGDLSKFDLRVPGDPWERRRGVGKALRIQVPREVHGEWKPSQNRPDPLELLARSNQGRQEHLIPLRMGRMAASPFTYLRGGTCVMAWDLAQTPASGITVVMDGDAHVNNFGLFGTPQRDIVFDLNDFDEAIMGPWEWDLKRLTASVNVAGRENGLSRRERRDAVMRCVTGYRENLQRLKSMGVLDVWYLHAYPGRKNPLIQMDPKAGAVVKKSIDKATQQTNASLLTKIAERGVNGAWRLREAPPVLTHVDQATREKIIDGLNAYADTLTRERRYMLGRYHVVDVGHRVVGVGSVGTRAYLVLLFGNGDDDPLFLQVKESCEPAHGPYLPSLREEFSHHGKRVVIGQRALQAANDIMLGWTTIDGRPFYVRQMKNMKGSIPIEWLSGEAFNFYAWACGAILARAHARTSDAAAISGYCGSSPVLDRSMALWAEAYGDQTTRDHAGLAEAIKKGRVKAVVGV
jgi:uncharacterized protein (DUF2252 family)